MLHNVPLEDPVVYDMICAADTIGVFQVESRAQMTMLPRLKPRCFYDLVIEVAIVRPGPIQGGMVHPFLRRRQGLESVAYPDERIKRILERTLGVPIFQEQVMEIAVAAGGFTPGEADQLRRAMASWRRDKNKLVSCGRKLVRGMIQNGYTKEFAIQIFEQIKGFGEYGFPQSHAASFALLVYVSAWLKKHHPAALAAGLINSQPMGFYQPAQIIRDARQHGVETRSIDVNHSVWDCSLEENGTSRKALRLGMRLIKGLHSKEAEQLQIAVQHHGFQRSIKELWRNSRVRISSLRTLARADAFLSMGIERQRALWEMHRLRDEYLPLFDGKNMGEVFAETLAPLPAVTSRSKVMRDYHFTGFSLKAHPLAFLRAELAAKGVVCCRELKNKRQIPDGSRTAVAGLVLIRQRPSTASGTIFITLEDETAVANLIIWQKVVEQYKNEICDSAIMLAHGSIQRESGVINLIVDDIFNISGMLNVEKCSRDFR